MNEADWRHLLGRIRAGNVVPILGPQLLADANGQSSLQARTAEKLLARYGNSVKPGSLPPFRESVARLQPSLGQKIYTEVDDLLHEAVNEADAAPPAIQQLSEIEDFRLFVTLTPDDCLARSLTKRCTVNEVFNSPYLGTEEKSRDLPADWHQRLGEVQLLYLFGKASPAPTFAVHDEDVLEYAHHLMSRGSQLPKRFLGELQERSLLLIGCNFPDWLSRFFLRFTNKGRLLVKGKRESIVEQPEDSLICFLNSYSKETEVLSELSPSAFVAELHQRWRQDRPIKPPRLAQPQLASVPQGVIFFISQGDLAQAESLFKHLRLLGADEAEVWFDRRNIEPGNDFRVKILQGIKSCRYFIPLLSTSVDQRERGFVFREWSEAADLLKEMGRHELVLPVIVDTVCEPTRFSGPAQQWLHLDCGHAPGGEPNDALRAKLTKLLRKERGGKLSMSDVTHLSAEHPWPGLAAYEESSKDFFYGRSSESDQLLQLIRLAPVTVLYGRSGLGKSSLLKAGVMPELRKLHFLPVYLRINFSPDAIEAPLDQVMRRLQEELQRKGAEFPEPDKGEDLWSWLHRRDLEIWSRDNHLLVPVFLFDQFEELFSHGDGDRLSRYALADLFENRIPVQLANDANKELSRYDLLTQRCRIVISFREEFLPDFENWTDEVLSLTRNRMWLMPLSREQAITAVRDAGAAVLAPGVAADIVDFVAGRDEDARPRSVDPVLLCLTCEQLNARRVANGAPVVDSNLLTEAGANILENFYSEAMQDMPVSVWEFIEERLTHGTRFRGSFPRDVAIQQNLLTLAQLRHLADDRRLLRIEQQADGSRIELIHDRLVPVICKKRDERLESDKLVAKLRSSDKAEAEQAAQLLELPLANAQAARFTCFFIGPSTTDNDLAKLRRVASHLLEPILSLWDYRVILPSYPAGSGDMFHFIMKQIDTADLFVADLTYDAPMSITSYPYGTALVFHIRSSPRTHRASFSVSSNANFTILTT